MLIHVGNTILVFRFSGKTPKPPPPHDGNDTSVYIRSLHYNYISTNDMKQRFISCQSCANPAGFMTALVCQDSSAVLHCPEESVINIQSAFYGRKSADICPHLDESGGVVAQILQSQIQKGI